MRLFHAATILLLVVLSSLFTQPVCGQQREEIDVLHYKIEAELTPDSNLLSATAAVTFRTPQPTQSAVFEMNGSLKITRITSQDGRELQFVQDTLDGLNVRIDLGTTTTAGQEVTLNFKYEGRLSTPEGGVLPNKRLAYVGAEGSYLTYAARWFPFHSYAADVATYEISFITPAEYTVVGLSTEEPKVAPYQPPLPLLPPSKPEKPAPKRPVSKRPSARSNFLPVVELVQSEPSVSLQRNVSTFTSRIPVLPGTFAMARYKSEKTSAGGTSLEVYYKPGREEAVSKLLKEMVEAFNFYSERFGEYAFGKRMIVAEIDNESLDTYTTAGITLVADKLLNGYLQADAVYREMAYQWWGQAVALKSFDDAWISQGLAQYSSMLLQEEQMPPSVFSEVSRSYMERALAFEQQASIRRAPATLDDQSEAYRSVVFYKGAFIYRMLQLVMGKEKFQNLLKSFYKEYRGRQASIADFEEMASRVHGSDLRYFFGQWVDSTGVPEFDADYQILKTRDGSYKVRGTLNQTSESFRMPVDIEVTFEGGSERITLNMDGKEADFNLPLKGMPKDFIVDPENKILKISDAIRVSVVVRRGIEHFRNEEFPEAEQQFQAAIKLYRYSSWAWYNLGLLYFEQKNYQKALDTFAETLELDLQPRWVEVWSYIKRGQCYDALGNRDRAVAEYNKAAQTGDNYEGAQEEVKKYLAAPYRPK